MKEKNEGMIEFIKNKLCLSLIAGLVLSVCCVHAQTPDSRLVLRTVQHGLPEGKISRGSYAVFEDREANAGRMIRLDLIILHATGPDPKPDPLFYLAGGPGQAAVDLYGSYIDSPLRLERDIVFVNHRGSGGDNFLQCELYGGDDNVQGYLENTFDVEAFRSCLEKLQKKFDLTKYSTPMAMDDLNEVREALGYDKINLIGTSGGTRSSLVYMRRHPGTVRTAILIGVAPLSNKNPLYHAWGAQRAVEHLFKECAADPDCSEAYPNLEEEFWTVLERLERSPVQVMVAHPAMNERLRVNLSLPAFTEAIRSMMYSVRLGREVPYCIHQAFLGNFRPVAQLAIEMERGSRQGISLGLLLCVTCSEDVARIKPDEITRATKRSFRGDIRVRSQMAVCEIWPKTNLPKDYGDPVRANIPALIFSGTLDPVTPPCWGEEAARHLPRSLHVVFPGAHGISMGCSGRIMLEFLTKGSAEGIDTSCVDSIGLPPFRLSEREEPLSQHQKTKKR